MIKSVVHLIDYFKKFRKDSGKTDHSVIKAPHNTSCFTQGLYYDAHSLMLYESCGSRDVSVLRVMYGPGQEVVLEKEFPEFLEGLTVVGDFIYVLTWKAGFMYVLDKRTLDVVSKCYYEGEGWGLTHDGEYFIMSNGSDRLTWFRIVGDGEKIEIKKELNIGVQNINELEWVDGHIYANVWYKDELLKIRVVDGSKETIDCSWLRKYERPNSGVLNGIAYDYVSKMFLITGKNWEGMYWVKG